MSGMKQRTAESASVSSTNFLGILYAEDFDDPGQPESNAEGSTEPKPLTQEDLDAACANAVRSAGLEWKRDEERQRTVALAAIGSAMAAIQNTAQETALAAAEGTVTTILSMIAGLLPDFCREHGPAEVRALLARLLPTVQSSTTITVRVHPELVAVIQRDVGELEPDLASKIAVTAAAIEPADVKVGWENGSLTRDSHQIMQAIQDALSQLGLYRKVEAPSKRTMAYAD